MKMKWSMAFLVACIGVFGPVVAAVRAHEGVIAVPIGERQLFLDDYAIADINNLTRTMHRPDKKGAVIRPRNADEGSILTLSAPMWIPEKKIYRIWPFTPPGYAESRDGLAWTRTALPPSKLPIHDAIYDPYDPDPSRRFKGMTYSREGLHPIVSDGLVWRKLNVQPIPAGDTNFLYLDEQERLFIATVKRGGPYGRSVALSTSKDFEHWTEPELIFHADALDQELGRRNIQARLADPTFQQPLYNDPTSYNVDVYDMAVFRYEGLYIGMPLMFHATGPIDNYPNTDGFKIIELVCSRSLRDWDRLGERKPFIGPSRLDSGAYDLTQIGPTTPILRTGRDSFSGQDELWFYYNGAKYRCSFAWVGEYPEGEYVRLPGIDPDQGAICLAVLRRDGFVSLDAGAEAGSITSKPLRIPDGAQQLFVNVDAPEGELHAVVLHTSGQPLPGFTVNECVPVTGNQFDAKVTWNARGNLAALAGQEVRLRFRLRHARLYSFWFE